MNEVDRNDLAALKEIMEAKFEAVQARFDALDRATELLHQDAKQKYKELNDVRARFIPREVFEAHNITQDERAQREVHSRRIMWATLSGIIITIIGYFITLNAF